MTMTKLNQFEVFARKYILWHRGRCWIEEWFNSVDGFGQPVVGAVYNNGSVTAVVDQNDGGIGLIEYDSDGRQTYNGGWGDRTLIGL